MTTTTEPSAAGRAFDELVAVTVLGWRWMHDPFVEALTPPDRFTPRLERGWEFGRHPDTTLTMAQLSLPHYSFEMGAAWELVEHLRARGWEYIIESTPANPGQHRCEFWHFGKDLNVGVRTDTAPHAICLASLKAVAVERGQAQEGAHEDW